MHFMFGQSTETFGLKGEGKTSFLYSSMCYAENALLCPLGTYLHLCNGLDARKLYVAFNNSTIDIICEAQGSLI